MVATARFWSGGAAVVIDSVVISPPLDGDERYLTSGQWSLGKGRLAASADEGLTPGKMESRTPHRIASPSVTPSFLTRLRARARACGRARASCRSSAVR